MIDERNFAALCDVFERLIEAEAFKTPFHDPVCYPARIALMELRNDYVPSGVLRRERDALAADLKAERERCAELVRYWLAGRTPYPGAYESRCIEQILNGDRAPGSP